APTSPLCPSTTLFRSSRPKLVPLRHRNLAASVTNIVDTYRLEPGDVSLEVMPLFHVHGLLASTLAALAAGGTVVVPTRFSAFERSEEHTSELQSPDHL